MSAHKGIAESLIADDLASGSFDQTRDHIALAQVHATLEAAQQQRIANLIALWTVSESEVEVLTQEGLNFGGILAQIREGLDLA